MSGRFAENTTVASDRSRAEIEKNLARYGADQFMYGTNRKSAVIGFVFNNLEVRFVAADA